MFPKWLRILITFLFSCNLCFASVYYSRSMLAQSVPHYAKVVNGKIEYYDIGYGTPIVLIGGYGSNVSGWDWRMIAALAADHRVILFDNRATGGTLINSNSYTMLDLATDTHNLVTALRLKKPVICGISMGGMIAQEYAVLFPKDMSQLVLINTAIAGDKFVQPSLAVQNEMASPPSSQFALYMRAVKLFFPPEWRLHMALTLLNDRFLCSSLKETPTTRNALLEQQNAIRGWTKDNATERLIAKLSMPVLILNGGEDEVIPPVNAEILANTIPHATMLRWPQGGHSMIYQFPVSIAYSISKFIGTSPV